MSFDGYVNLENDQKRQGAIRKVKYGVSQAWLEPGERQLS